MSLIWDWQYAIEIIPELLNALWATVILAALASVGAVGLGLVMAVLAYIRIPILSPFVRLFIQFIRGTPLLVQLYFAFYILPLYGFALNAYVTGVIALALYISSYCAEAFRGGVVSVPQGQWEAARAVGLSASSIWLSVILPNAVRRVLPPLGGYVLLLFKETALLQAITVSSVLTVAFELGTQSFRYVEPLTIAALMYLLVSYPAAFTLRRLEARLAN